METLVRPQFTDNLPQKLTKYAPSKWEATYFAKSAEALIPAFESGQLDHIRHVAFDVDGTLMDHHDPELPEWAVDLLRYLLDRKLDVSIISNAYGNRSQEVVDIFKAVDRRINVVTPEHVKQSEDEDPRIHRKPARTMPDRLAELNGVPPEATLIVGDQLMKDIVTARTIGAQGLLVAKVGKPERDDPLVRILQRPLEVIARQAQGLPGSWEDFPDELTRRGPEHRLAGKEYRHELLLNTAAALGVVCFAAIAATRQLRHARD